MTREPIYDTIKETAHQYLPGARILLFGSRARGNHQPDSDYDLMVVTQHQLSPQRKDKLGDYAS